MGAKGCFDTVVLMAPSNGAPNALQLSRRTRVAHVKGPTPRCAADITPRKATPVKVNWAGLSVTLRPRIRRQSTLAPQLEAQLVLVNTPYKRMLGAAGCVLRARIHSVVRVPPGPANLCSQLLCAQSILDASRKRRDLGATQETQTMAGAGRGGNSMGRRDVPRGRPMLWCASIQVTVRGAKRRRSALEERAAGVQRKGKGMSAMARGCGDTKIR
ncbi:hypothetical protein BC834DRAFT_73993 [Gloeopeniophorella convolvens]|nr:hypothetical protein BC834DRAFT_73993 [Gloeopeniophorella convolvens]